MASLALGVLGAGIGSYFGQASLGFFIGQAIGGSFGGNNIPSINTTNEGPRMNDLRVSSATYGAPIPITYGATRIAGNLIWSTGIIETKHTTTQSSGGGGGGKGGGGGGGGDVTQTTITYTYSASFAIAICEGVIQGIRRIWADSKLIYDLGPNATPMSIYQSNSLSSANKIYFGTDTQMPDPVIQSHFPAGDVPAYRNVAYMVFDNLQLQDYGNRIPNLEFEVVNSAVIGGARELALNLHTSVHFSTASVPGEGHPAVLSFDGTLRVTAGQNDIVYLFNPDGIYLGQDVRQTNEYYPDVNSVIGSSVPVGILNGYGISACNLGTKIGDALSLPAVFFTKVNNSISTDLGNALPPNEYVGGCAISTYQTRIAVFTAPVSPLPGTAVINKYYIVEYSGDHPVVVDSGTIAVPLSIANIGFGNSAQFSYFICASMEENLNYVWILQGGQTQTAYVYSFENNIMTLVDQIDGVFGTSFTTVYPSVYAKNGLAWCVGGDRLGVVSRIQSATITTASLSEIVTDLIERSVLTSSDIDVASLSSDIVPGYLISKPMTVRQAIQPLQQAFWFDATESDGIIKFIKRGTTSSIVTITNDELAAYSAGDTIPDAITTMRTQELDLPRRVNVTYYNYNSSFQQAEQYAARLITQSEQVTNIELPIALDDAHAANVASVLLYNAWLERNTRMLTLTSKYVYIDPCDIITVISEDATFVLRVLQTDYGDNGIVRLKTVDEDAAVYDPNTVSAEGGNIPQVVSMPGPTKLVLMDIPLLRDQDDNPGFYWAACGYLDYWRGAALFKSLDGGASYTNSGSTVRGSIIGRATTVLGNYTGHGNTFDEFNTVTVAVINGELFNDTIDNILNNTNFCVIGSEVLQFKNAELIDDNTYLLSGLLRGRRGTEWAQGLHAVNDVFVFADARSWQRNVPDLGEIGVTRTWKAATIGTTIAEAIPYNFADTGVGLKPYSPVDIGGGRDASLNIIINWIRRGRIGGGWLDNVNVPLGEGTESYDVDILNGVAVVRTLSSATPTVTYTAAQQVTDFGSTQSTIHFRVYQLSQSIGRGYAGAGTV